MKIWENIKAFFKSLMKKKTPISVDNPFIARSDIGPQLAEKNILSALAAGKKRARQERRDHDQGMLSVGVKVSQTVREEAKPAANVGVEIPQAVRKEAEPVAKTSCFSCFARFFKRGSKPEVNPTPSNAITRKVP